MVRRALGSGAGASHQVLRASARREALHVGRCTARSARPEPADFHQRLPMVVRAILSTSAWSDTGLPRCPS